MAQTGFTPLFIYSSTTAAAAPIAANLANGTLGSELAVNITDGKLFYKDNVNAIQVLAWKLTPTTAGGTGLSSYTAGDLLYYATGTTLSKLGIGTAYYQLGVNSGGTAPVYQPSATSVLTTQGDLLYASAANTLARLAKNTSATRYLANTGSSNNPAWAQIDVSNGITGTVPVGNGGTGQTSWTANGILYANGSTTLANGVGLTFDGTNLATTGTVSATKFIPTGGSATGNGMYLPAANQIAWSINGSEVIRLNATGQLGIGTNAPTNPLTVTSDTSAQVRIGTVSANVNARITLAASGTGINVLGSNGTSALAFYSGSTEQARFDTSGNFLLNTTTNSGTLTVKGNQYNAGSIRVAANGAVALDILNEFGTEVGYIQVNGAGTGTVYATSSDQRLKENIVDAKDAGALIDAIQVRQFDWISSGTHEDYGLIAQELMLVCPDAVSHGQTEDSMKAVDYSKLIPLLVKEIQSLRSRVNGLETQ
jgi:hypothetical protein